MLYTILGENLHPVVKMQKTFKNKIQFNQLKSIKYFTQAQCNDNQRWQYAQSCIEYGSIIHRN